MSDDSLRSLVECPVCFEVPRVARVYICINGHSICGGCKDRVSICPQGRCAFASPPTRNRTVESILEAGYDEASCRNSHLGCTFEGPRKRMERHEHKCTFRRMKCPLDCSKQIRALDLFDHLEFTCRGGKTMICSIQGCSQRLRVSELDSHLASCPYRVVPCPLRCPDPGLRSCDLDAHVSDACWYRIGECSNEGCSERMKFLYLSDHEAACDFRIVPCPIAPTCSATFRPERTLSHLNNECIARIVKCENEGCQRRIRAFERSSHASACLFRMVSCPNAPSCDMKIVTGRKTLHLELECKARAVACTQVGCYFKGTPCAMLSCPSGMAYCPNGDCRGRSIAQPDAKEHGAESHEASCMYRMVSCSNEGCSTRRAASEMYEHEYRCPFQVVACSYSGCSHKTRVNKLPAHRSLHLMPCSNKGCQFSGVAFNLKAHEMFYCPLRLVMCKYERCYTAKRANIIKLHEAWCFCTSAWSEFKLLPIELKITFGVLIALLVDFFLTTICVLLMNLYVKIFQ